MRGVIWAIQTIAPEGAKAGVRIDVTDRLAEAFLDGRVLGWRARSRD